MRWVRPVRRRRGRPRHPPRAFAQGARCGVARGVGRAPVGMMNEPSGRRSCRDLLGGISAAVNPTPAGPSPRLAIPSGVSAEPPCSGDHRHFSLKVSIAWSRTSIREISLCVIFLFRIWLIRHLSCRSLPLPDISYLASPIRFRSSLPAAVRRYRCLLLRGLSGMVISIRPASRAGVR